MKINNDILELCDLEARLHSEVKEEIGIAEETEDAHLMAEVNDKLQQILDINQKMEKLVNYDYTLLLLYRKLRKHLFNEEYEKAEDVKKLINSHF